MGKSNCWEFKKCGREAGGYRAHEMGVCPAASLTAAHGFLGGKNGGRGCCYVTGTFCSDSIRGTHREKEKNCDVCDFYHVLRKEHGAGMSIQAFLHYVRNA